MSDGAGQFRVGTHALCWVHAERLVHKLVPATPEQHRAVEVTRSLIWWFYADLKAWARDPCPRRAAALRALSAFYRVNLPTEWLPSLALSAETAELGIPAGLQDRVIQTYEGLVYMDFSTERSITENALKKYRTLFEDFQESLRKYGRKYGVGLTQTRCRLMN